MSLNGLERASKSALQHLIVLMGDDLSGNGWGDEVEATMSSSKADLVTVIEQYVTSMTEENNDMLGVVKDVSADIGHRGIANSRLTTNRF